jgi:hypothetical protein
MAKEKVIRNNPNIRFNFSDLNIPRNLASRQESRRSKLNVNPISKIDRRGRENRPGLLSQQIINDQTEGLINDSTESTANVASVASLLNLPILENAERQYADSSLQAIANNFAREELNMEQTEALMKIQNQQRLAARNKGIGQMLFALSDALGGRDVVGRLLERQAAMQPEEEDLTARQKEYQEYIKIMNDPNISEEDKIRATEVYGRTPLERKKSKAKFINETRDAIIRNDPYVTEEDLKEAEENASVAYKRIYGSEDNSITEPVPTEIFKVGGYTIQEG